MVELEKLEYWAKKKEKQNYKFRTYLKCHADPDELDKQFKQLHKKIFENYDCSKCRNCCKAYCGTIPFDEVERDADFLGISVDDFKTKFLESEANAEGYNTKNCPCDFLVNNECILEDNKPVSCKEFPYTDREDRMGSLLGIVEFTSVCPVVYEIMEELKGIYEFY